MQTSTARGWQTVVGFGWVTLGLVPLVTLLFGGNGGLWGRVLADDAGAWRWIAPVAVVVVGLVVLVALDRAAE